VILNLFVNLFANQYINQYIYIDHLTNNL